MAGASGSGEGTKEKSCSKTRGSRKKMKTLTRSSQVQANSKELTEEAISSPNEEAVELLKASRPASPLTSSGKAMEATQVADSSSNTSAAAAAEAEAAEIVPLSATKLLTVAVAASKVVATATDSVLTATMASTVEVGKVSESSSYSEDNAPPKKLLEVVRAASAVTPSPAAPLGAALRPPLATAAPKYSKLAPMTQTRTSVAAAADVHKGVSFAQAVSGTSKPSLNKNAPIAQIKCRPIPPRRPPPEVDSKKSKPEGNLQEVWEKRWHTMDHSIVVEYVQGTSQGVYLGAIEKVVGPQIFALGITGRGTVSVCLNTIEAAQKLMLEGIQVAGRHLIPYPEAVKPRRVVLSRVPIRADNEDILSFLRQFGTVHGKMRAIPIKLGENGLGKGVFSLSREVFMTVKQGCELPTALIIECDGVRAYVGITTEAKCYACQQTGHLIAGCPKRKLKTVSKGTPEGAVIPPTEFPELTEKVNPSTSSLAGQSAMGGPKPSAEATSRTKGIPSQLQEKSSSSDEEVVKKRKKRRKLKKRREPTDLETMPPPPSPVGISKTSTVGVKRHRSGEEVLSAKRRVSESPAVDISDLSDCETVLSIEMNERSTAEVGYKSAQSGYESSVSTLSIKGQFDIVPECGSLRREQICSLLKRLYRKQNKEYISRTIYEFTDNPQNLVPQIEKLQARARANKDYNEAARLDRVLKQIEMAVANRTLEDSSSL